MRSVRLALALTFVLACSSDDTTKEKASSTGASDGGATGSATSPGGEGSVAPADDNALLPSTSVWRTTSEWYRLVDGAPVVEHSAALLAALDHWGDTGDFQIDFSFDVLDATGGTPTTFPANEETDDVPVPVPAKGYIEGDHAYDACKDGDDCHMLILDRPGLRLYEVYHAHLDGSSWQGEVALWKLDKTYPRQNRGKGCTSADVSGLAITPGLIGYRETRAGAIQHALRFIVPNERIRGDGKSKTFPNVAYPASHGSTAASSATSIPYGARLRLKIDETDPRVTSPGAKAVVRALRHYGMILTDGGRIPLVAESARVAHDADGAATWDGLLGPKDVAFLTPQDFEVIAIPKDRPGGETGWYATKKDYEAQLQTPLGCDTVVQP